MNGVGEVRPQQTPMDLNEVCRFGILLIQFV